MYKDITHDCQQSSVERTNREIINFKDKDGVRFTDDLRFYIRTEQSVFFAHFTNWHIHIHIYKYIHTYVYIHVYSDITNKRTIRGLVEDR